MVHLKLDTTWKINVCGPGHEACAMWAWCMDVHAHQRVRECILGTCVCMDVCSVCACALHTFRRRACLHTHKQLCGQTQVDISVSWCKYCVCLHHTLEHYNPCPSPHQKKLSIFFQHSLVLQFPTNSRTGISKWAQMGPWGPGSQASGKRVGGADKKLCIFPAGVTPPPPASPGLCGISRIGWLPPTFHWYHQVTSFEELMGMARWGAF